MLQASNFYGQSTSSIPPPQPVPTPWDIGHSITPHLMLTPTFSLSSTPPSPLELNLTSCCPCACSGSPQMPCILTNFSTSGGEVLYRSRHGHRRTEREDSERQSWLWPLTRAWPCQLRKLIYLLTTNYPQHIPRQMWYICNPEVSMRSIPEKLVCNYILIMKLDTSTYLTGRNK